MKRFLISIKHIFVGHEISQHKMFQSFGAYYCAGCNRYYEYYYEPFIGIVEHQITKECFERMGLRHDDN